MNKECLTCKGVLPRKHKKYCSKKCQMDATPTKRCKECYKLIRKSVSSKQWATTEYCSHRCRGYGKSRTKDLEVYCWWCEELIETSDKGLVHLRRRKFCSREHFRLFMRQPRAQERISLGKWRNLRKNWRPTQRRLLVLLASQGPLQWAVLTRGERVSARFLARRGLAVAPGAGGNRGKALLRPTQKGREVVAARKWL